MYTCPVVQFPPHSLTCTKFNSLRTISEGRENNQWALCEKCFTLWSLNRCECINLFCASYLLGISTCPAQTLQNTLTTSPICSQRHCLKALTPWSIIITNVHVKWLSDNQKTSEFYACLQVMAAQVVVWWKRPLTPNRFFFQIDWCVNYMLYWQWKWWNIIYTMELIKSTLQC